MKKALVVDDTKTIRNLLTTCLEVNGYEVYTANDGNAAIEMFKKVNLDIAFLDIKMPEMSGTEVLRQIRSAGIDIPVVIMTAFATVKNAVECTKLGAVAYLQKPFTADKVKNTLNELDEFVAENNDIIRYIEYSKKKISEGKTGEALNILKKALAVNPDYGEVYYLIGKVYDAEGNFEQASKFYHTAELFDYKMND